MIWRLLEERYYRWNLLNNSSILWETGLSMFSEVKGRTVIGKPEDIV